MVMLIKNIYFPDQEYIHLMVIKNIYTLFGRKRLLYCLLLLLPVTYFQTNLVYPFTVESNIPFYCSIVYPFTLRPTGINIQVTGIPRKNAIVEAIDYSVFYWYTCYLYIYTRWS